MAQPNAAGSDVNACCADSFARRRLSSFLPTALGPANGRAQLGDAHICGVVRPRLVHLAQPTHPIQVSVQPLLAAMLLTA